MLAYRVVYQTGTDQVIVTEARKVHVPALDIDKYVDTLVYSIHVGTSGYFSQLNRYI